jgi:hypothetical protein
MAESREPHPPSDPRPTLGRDSLMSRAEQDRSMRVQLIAALVLGVAFIASGLYLWRRPRTPSDGSALEAAAASASASVGDAAGPPVAVAEAGTPPPVTLSDTRILACHDRGPKKTAPDQCDHLAPLEKALANAVEQSAACLPESVGGATIEYVADVSFLRHRVSVILPRAGRSVRDQKALVACASAVRSAMSAVELGSVDHQHARYKISVTATYRHALRGG